MSPRLQAKLLRFLQDGCFRRVGSDEEVYLDVRVICATQVDLSELCARANSARTSITVSMCSRCTSRRCASAWMAWRRSPSISSTRPAGRSAAACRSFPRRRWNVSNATTGRATCGNWKTCCSRRFRCAKGNGQGRAHPPAGLRRAAAAGDFSLEGDLDAIVGRFERRCWSACSANIRAAASWASASAFRIPRRRTSCASMAWGKARAERHACRFVAGWERNGGGVGPCERAAAR